MQPTDLPPCPSQALHYKHIVLTTLVWGSKSWALKCDHLRKLHTMHAARMILRTTRWIHQEKESGCRRWGTNSNLSRFAGSCGNVGWDSFLVKTADLPPTNLYRRLMFCQATTTGKRGSSMSTARSYAEDLKKHQIFVTSIKNQSVSTNGKGSN